MTDKKDDKSTWAIGGGVVLGTGIGFFSCRHQLWRSQARYWLAWVQALLLQQLSQMEITETYNCIQLPIADIQLGVAENVPKQDSNTLNMVKYHSKQLQSKVARH